MTRPVVLSELPFHRRQAKAAAKADGMKLCAAQNRYALLRGFECWATMVRWCNSAEAPKNLVEFEEWLHRRPDRLYVHGDQSERDSGRFFCVRCTQFVEPSHFRRMGFHRDGRDVDIYLGAMDAQAAARRGEPSTKYFRPLHAPNALAGRAAERPLPVLSSLRGEFHRWLELQTGRPTGIGTFARFAMRSPKFPAHADTFNEMLAFLGGEKDWFFEDAREAWAECLTAKTFMQGLAG